MPSPAPSTSSPTVSVSGVTGTHGVSGGMGVPGVVEVPEYFHLVDSQVLTHMIADMLCRLTSHNDQIPLTQSNLTRFHSRAPPAISIGDYLKRIVKYASVERVCLLILLIYIDRVCERNRSFTISSLTVHRFIITGVTVGSKALCDSFLQNSMYAKVGGISTKELNILELEFLFLIDWDLTATAERLQEYYLNLVRQHPQFRRAIPPGAGPSPPLRGEEGTTPVGIGVLDGNIQQSGSTSSFSSTTSSSQQQPFSSSSNTTTSSVSNPTTVSCLSTSVTSSSDLQHQPSSSSAPTSVTAGLDPEP
ncbi:hypothetical protein HDU67_002623 [Dinochytrium kinnereticum]|nr:hypothetical protein HDU67_002623 [Dinochytrium kinnereticum]